MSIRDSFVLRLLSVFFALILLSGLTCKRLETHPEKIGFDLSELDEEGLSTQAGGKVSVDYEFCIPAKEDLAKAVQSIDPSVQIQKKAKGRIECNKNQWLCLGNTHQKDYKDILLRLTVLEYVERIEQAFFE
ncbi:MAG: hypothetical protein AAFP19_02900 [Bacteroidota bacterium]